jgi:hypothetical protein
MIEFEQHVDETLDYSVNFAGHCVRVREPDTDYAENIVVQPKRATGLQYRATTGGRSGTKEPRWPLTAALTVTDGTVVWTAEATSEDSLRRTLDSVSWAADTGLTVGSASSSGVVSTALISDGVAGQSYEVHCTGTFSDETIAIGQMTINIRD